MQRATITTITIEKNSLLRNSISFHESNRLALQTYPCLWNGKAYGKSINAWYTLESAEEFSFRFKKKKKNEPVQMRYEMREFRVKFSCSNVQATYLISKQTTTDSFLRVSCSFLFHTFLRLINFFSSSSRSFSIVSIFGSSHLNAEFSKRIWKESV